MKYPDFIKSFPGLDVPFPDDVVQIHAIRSDRGLVVFFDFLQDMVLPAHSHGAQWGTVIAGEIELTIGDVTKTYRPGDTYDIGSGVVHRARIPAGAKVIDVFEEPDRYLLKG
ncbi:MAG: cupin domain-containing protein [Paracoccaceae bacterium]